MEWNAGSGNEMEWSGGKCIRKDWRKTEWNGEKGNKVEREEIKLSGPVGNEMGWGGRKLDGVD